MSPLWMVVMSLWCSAVVALTGCASGGPPADPVSADVYLARPRAVVPGKMIVPHVSNSIGGNVFIVTGRGDEVSADVMATVSGDSPEAARIGAGRRITVTNDAGNVEVRLLPEEGEKNPASQLSARLHVAVPPATDLPDINTPSGNIEIYGNVGNVKAMISNGGNIEVYGNVGNVTAVISNSGNIDVRGADGQVNLSTQKGSIIADVMRDHDITLHAVDGAIDLHAVNAVVSAVTTNQDIRFYGTLRAGQAHNFSTTAAGSIHVALPAYPRDYPTPQVYRFYIATSANPVNMEYPARGTDNQALPICGFIHSSGPYDYHVENTPAGMGRIEVSPVITSTYFFSGTLATSYFRFDTNQTRVAFYTPLPQSIHIYTADQLNQIIAGNESIAPECRAALERDSNSAIVLNLKTDSGLVYVRQMRMLGD